MRKIFTILSIVLGFNFLFAQTGEFIEFNGVDQYMKIANHDDFNVTTSESFTVAMWVNMAELKPGYNARFVSKRSQATDLANKSGWELWGGNSVAQFCAVNSPNAAGNHDNSVSVFATDATAGANVWVHFALVVDRQGGKMYEYLNGVEKASSGTKNIAPWAVSNPYDVFVGAGITGTYPVQNTIQHFKGKIADLRFYKKALSPSDIVAEMTAEVTAETPGLVAAYDFNGITGAIVPDITGNHPGTLYNFPVVGPVEIISSSVLQDKNFTGRGNKNEVLLKAVINTSGMTSADISEIKMSLEGTSDLASIDNVKVYTTGTINKFDSRNPDATLLGSASAAEGEITVETDGKLVAGTNYIWITVDVAETAVEGSAVDATLTSIKTSNETHQFENGNPAGKREVLLRRTLVFAPGDYGSANYRIPAIITADDGSLVVITDKRKYNSVDLPEDIDILARRSTDGGKTWSEPVTIAEGQGRNKGYGDAVLIKTNSGKLVALYVGGVGLWGASANNPLRHYISTSDDHGVTWTAPRDITPMLYGSESNDPVRKNWQSSFFGSGRGLTLRDGRIMAVIAVRETLSNYNLNNYIVYSDDEGETWNVSEKAMQSGDEAKVVELNDGTVLISSRTSGYRLWAKSTDRGITWGPKNSWSEIWGNACDADIVRYTSTLDGYDKDRILHTLPNASNRTNVSMWISYDEATSWPVKKTLCEGESAYSSITILPDGTIGVYLEEDESVPYKMYFLNFSLDWLTDGADSFTEAGVELVEQPVFSLEAGRYGPQQTVTISTATEGAAIYYTIDGTTPSSSATLYTEPIVLDETCTLKAIAIKEGMANSIFTSAEYIIGYVIPKENREVGPNRYVTDASTVGGIENIEYIATEAPESHYTYHKDTKVRVKRADTFTLKLNAALEDDGLEWTQAIILVDWNQDYKFDGSGERIAIIGNRETNNGTIVLNISQDITVPSFSEFGTTRMRVVYTDGWRPISYDDLGEDPVDKGRIYDFDLEVNSTVGTDKLGDSGITVNNPVNNQLQLNIPSGNYDLSLMDVNGRSLINRNLSQGTHTIDLSHLVAQMFLMRLTDREGNIITKKLIKY